MFPLPLLTKVDNANRLKYEVFEDPDAYQSELHLLDAEIASDIANGDLRYFGIIKNDVCACCCEYREIDSVWGIIAMDEQDALEQYLEQYI